MVAARKWTPEEDAILGTCSDFAAAKRLGTANVTVKKRRVALGIAEYEKPDKPSKSRRFIGDQELNAKLDELKPFLIQEFNRRGVPVRDVDDRSAIQFLIDQALSAAKKSQTRALFQGREQA